MYAIIHLPTAIQISERDCAEVSWGNMTGEDLYDPNKPEVPPKLYFKTLYEAKKFIENNAFVFDDEAGIPLIALEWAGYKPEYIIPKYQLEPIEIV